MNPIRLRAADGTIIGWGQADLRRGHVDITIASDPATTSNFALDVPLRLVGPPDALDIDTARRESNRTPVTRIDVARLPADVRALLAASACGG